MNLREGRLRAEALRWRRPATAKAGILAFLIMFGDSLCSLEL